MTRLSLALLWSGLMISQAVSALDLNSKKSNTEPDWVEIEKIAQKKKIHEHQTWFRLLHYKCRFGICSSQEDGEFFILSPTGKTNIESELQATIHAFKTDALIDFKDRRTSLRARCVWPARLTWLSRQTGGWPVDDLLKDCSEFVEFQNKLAAKSVSLVFSSFYLNNPSSAFGHTLLKFNKQSEGQKSSTDLLSHSISYAANPTTSNPVLYAVYGLIGGFRGTYSSLPYYYKVREYNDYESRDIWDYELNLKPEEIDLLIKHIWELGFSEFNYFYLTENCASHLIDAIDVATEKFNLSDDIPYWVLPLDTVKAVTSKSELIQKYNVKISQARSLEKRFAYLLNEEKDQFFQSIKSYDTRQIDSARVLDAVIDHFDYANKELLIEKNKQLQITKHKLLSQRSRMPEMPAPITTDHIEPPHESHGSLRLELGQGIRDQLSGDKTKSEAHSNSTHFGVRFALHDLVDPTWGLPQYARLEMFSGDFYYDDHTKRLHTERLRFVGIESLNSWSSLWRQPAWRFDMGADRINDTRCNNCLATTVGAAIGLATMYGKNMESVASSNSDTTFLRGFTPFIYLNARARGGKFMNDDFSTELGPSIGLRLLTAYDVNFIAEYERRTIWNSFRDTLNVYNATLQKNFDQSYAFKLHHQAADSWQATRLSLLIFL